MSHMISPRPSITAPLVFFAGLVAILAAPWMAVAADNRMSLATVGVIGVALSAAPARRWLTALGRRPG